MRKVLQGEEIYSASAAGSIDGLSGRKPVVIQDLVASVTVCTVRIYLVFLKVSLGMGGGCDS